MLSNLRRVERTRQLCTSRGGQPTGRLGLRGSTPWRATWQFVATLQNRPVGFDAPRRKEPSLKVVDTFDPYLQAL